MNTDTAAPAPTYTDQEATDEALLLFMRRLRREHPDAYRAVESSLSEGARDALDHAEHRADALRFADSAQGIRIGSRPYPKWNEPTDDDA